MWSGKGQVCTEVTRNFYIKITNSFIESEYRQERRRERIWYSGKMTQQNI